MLYSLLEGIPKKLEVRGGSTNAYQYSASQIIFFLSSLARHKDIWTLKRILAVTSPLDDTCIVIYTNICLDLPSFTTFTMNSQLNVGNIYHNMDTIGDQYCVRSIHISYIYIHVCFAFEWVFDAFKTWWKRSPLQLPTLYLDPVAHVAKATWMSMEVANDR